MGKYTFKSVLAILLLIIVSNVALCQLVNISYIRSNDANGIPTLLDNVYQITGTVTAANEFNSPSYLQDATGGVAVYARGAGLFSQSVTIGDSVILTGHLTQYNGLTQFDNLSSWTKISSGNTVEPKLLTITDILNQQWNGIEAFEGMLIRINNVSVSATGNWEGNKNYVINDGTANLPLRISKETNIPGYPIPTGKFDIVGCLGAFSTTQPYYERSYQLLPRSLEDFLGDKSPFIILPVTTPIVTSNSFNILFSSVREGDTKVSYGKTIALELGSPLDAALTKTHTLNINNLDSDTRYYFQVSSTNTNGTSLGPIQTVVTGSNNPNTGKINIYFNGDVDKSVAITGNEANGNVNFVSKIIDRINSAQSSIDFTVYSFNNPGSIATAVIAAKSRGVKIRVVADSGIDTDAYNQLTGSGIQIQKRSLANSGSSSIMHNKFWIFDARDTDPTNDWVWTGSWNTTSNATNNTLNNVIEINDHALALAYTDEFEEMWGSSDETPNPSNSKFGAMKTDNTQHYFTVGNRQLQCYFSPGDHVADKVERILRTADSTIYFSLLTFTQYDFSTAILDEHTLGATVRGVFGDTSATGTQFSLLKTVGQVYYYNLGGVFHHKYGIVDASCPTLDPTVVSGSYNWTKSADAENDENIVVIHDLLIANQYMQEFKKRYNDLGGTGIFVVPNISGIEDPSNISQNIDFTVSPNPSISFSTATFSLPVNMKVNISLHNTNGEKICNIYDNYSLAGKTVVDFKTDWLPSGAYFLELKSGEFVKTQQLLIIK